MAEKTKEGNGEYAIECRGLTRKFGNFTAVDGLSIKVKKGELFGFLGPNGAGKTTSISMLTTLISPTSGTAIVAGADLKEQAAIVRSRIGVVPQTFSLFEELTPIENLWYIGELYEMPHALVEKRTEEILKIVRLNEKKDVQSGTFSGGMKQRLSVAAGLLHSPEILFMDEPTTGLDPQSRIALRELTQRLNSEGMTVIYTTHDMYEADAICQRIGIMDRGKLIALGTPAELKALKGYGQKIILETGKHSPALAIELGKLLGASYSNSNGNTIELRMQHLKGGAVHKITDFLAHHHLSLENIDITEPTLEDVFIALTKKELRD
jgi:ABC-2 type transport system ATP-binding protein